MKVPNALYITIFVLLAILFAGELYIKQQQAHEKQVVAEMGDVPVSVIEKSIQPIK